MLPKGKSASAQLILVTNIMPVSIALARSQIGVEDRPAKAKARIACQRNRLGLVLHAKDHGGRAKEFVVKGGVCGFHIGQDRRQHMAARAIYALAAHHQLGTMFGRNSNLRRRINPCLLSGQRAKQVIASNGSPSSIDDGFSALPALAAMLRPAAKLPVSATPLMRGSATKASDCLWLIIRLVYAPSGAPASVRIFCKGSRTLRHAACMFDDQCSVRHQMRPCHPHELVIGEIQRPAPKTTPIGRLSMGPWPCLGFSGMSAKNLAVFFT